MSFVSRLIYMWLVAASARVPYYIAWTLGDLVCNASGLGFNGYDSNGHAKWNLVTNINILNVEVIRMF
jgi:lysophospholipid acyltransferase 1/2